MNPIKSLNSQKNKRGWIVILVLFSISLFLFINNNQPDIKPWHRVKLLSEFTADKVDLIKNLDQYRQLENELFHELEEKVYSEVKIGKQYDINRYSAGSAADPQAHSPNWNRTFEFPVDTPKGGVLLLHGMSDSPYSLRSLAERFKKNNFWVVGLRLPGHGTIPSGLKYITWEDMAAAVTLAVQHLKAKVGDKPLHMVGYSTGASLALNFTLDALEEKIEPVPSSLILISPAIGVQPAAGLAAVRDWFSIIPGLGHLAWLSVYPEFDPYKYNSFATNAGTQVHRITRNVANRLRLWVQSHSPDTFPPILTFKSTIDATVSTTAVIEKLLKPLNSNRHELVLFDINRYAATSPLLVDDPGPLTRRLLEDKTLPFVFSLVTNENSESMDVIEKRKLPFSTSRSAKSYLGMRWPAGVISLSHVALPFPPDDPLYGEQPSGKSELIFLGQMAIKGERGFLRIPSDWLMRLRHNPFYSYLDRRTLEWVKAAGEL